MYVYKHAHLHVHVFANMSICIDDCNRCNFYEVHLWKLNHWSKKTCLSRCLYFLIPYLPPFFLSDLVSPSPLVGKDNDTFLSCALNSFHTHWLLLFPRSFRVRNYVFSFVFIFFQQPKFRTLHLRLFYLRHIFQHWMIASILEYHKNLEVISI